MFFMEGLSGVNFKVYGDVPTKKDPVNALLVANHQCVSDWIIIDSFAMRLGNAGWIRILLLFEQLDDNCFFSCNQFGGYATSNRLFQIKLHHSFDGL